MLTNLNTIPTELAYRDNLFNFLVGLEEPIRSIYLDNAQSRNPTIGVGFNLRNQDVLDSVLQQMGFTFPLTGQDATDRNTLLAIFQSTTLTAAQMQTQADAVIAARGGQRTTFQFSEGSTGVSEMRAVFDVVADQHAQDAINRLNALGATGFTAATWSQELIALTSLVYNGGPKIIGQKLANAIRDDNRAAAWYEIAFNSNLQAVFGLQNRRLQEAEMFGLYPTVSGTASVTDDSAKNVYRVFSTQGIAAVERKLRSLWHTDAAGNRTSPVTEAEVTTFLNRLHSNLMPAHDHIVDTWGLPNGFTNVPINGIVVDPIDPRIDPTHSAFLNGIYYGNLGQEEALTNIIIGEGGTDYLLGGKGDDLLMGGDGYDYYYWREGDGNDVIVDADRRGQIIISGPSYGDLFSSAPFIPVDGQTNTWATSDGRLTLFHGANWVLNTPNGSTINLGTTLNDGDFGINFGVPRDIHEYTTQGPAIIGDADGNTLNGGAGADPISGLAGNDTLHGSGGDDFLEGGDDDDRLFGENDFDRLFGGAGLDELYGGLNDDELFGGDDRDILEGGAGADRVAGEAGRDIVVGNEDDDVVFGGAPIESSALTAAIAAGESEAGSGLAGDWLDGGEGEDTLLAGADNDFLAGGGGSDILVGGGGDDNLIGDAERVLVSLNWSVTRDVSTTPEGMKSYGLVYSDASIFESPAGAGDELRGGAGSDWLFGGRGDDLLYGNADDDVLFGQHGADVLLGSTGNDVLVGDDPGKVSGADEGSDYLDGGAGDDFLQGDGGDDYLMGGAGNDTLIGGAGKDTYFFKAGDGQDEIFDDATGAEASVLVFGDGYDSSNMTLRPGSMVLDFGNGDAVHLGGFDHFDPNAAAVFDALIFDDGTTLGFDEVLARGFDIDGTEDHDDGHDEFHPVITGTAFDDRIRGLGGNDVLFGLQGNDSLTGGDGNDQLVGGDNDDLLSGDVGDDALFGEAGDDVLDGGDGVDHLQAGEGNDQLAAGSGDDTLYGEAGNDFLDGGIGNDFLFGDFDIESATDGADTLVGGDGNDQLVGSGGLDMLDGGSGVDLLFGGSGDDVLSGGDDNDELQGNDGADTLAGGRGDDTLFGDAGDDVYLFNLGDGKDLIFDDSTVSLDVLRFGPGIAISDLTVARTGIGGRDLVLSHANGTDKVTIANWYVGAGFQMSQIEFADGTMLTATQASDLGRQLYHGTEGNDSLSGTSLDDQLYGFGGADGLHGNSGNDTLVGGTGNDFLSGGPGNDTYLVELGDGHDEISEFDAAGIDALVFGSGVAKADITPSRVGQDLHLANSNGTDKVVVLNYFGQISVINSVTFAGTGESFSLNELTSPFNTLTGTPNADTINGGWISETILGLEGNDTISGGGGNDSIIGGPGNDSLAGGADTDTYFFRAGDGQDFIGDFEGPSTVQFGPGLVDVFNIESQSNGRLITFTGSTDSVFVDGFTPFTFAFEVEGTGGADTITGTEHREIIQGFEGNDTLQGGLGADILHGDDGDDVLAGNLISESGGGATDNYFGGTGNDTIWGNDGNETYNFNLGDGQDTIFERPLVVDGVTTWSVGDVMRFGEGITPDMLSGVRSGNDLIITISPTDQIILKDQLRHAAWQIDSFRFFGGVTWSSFEINDLPNIRRGTSGDDTLTGAEFNEQLFGMAGNDTLIALAGNDRLDGGTGDDSLFGGDGNDRYYFRAGYGHDTITDASGAADDVHFDDSSLSASDITLTRNVNSLVLSFNGTNDSVTITDYLTNSAGRIESFLFNNGSQLPTTAEIIEQVVTLRGTSGDDALTGSDGYDRIFGSDGNDSLNGLVDNDELFGEAGNDVYLYNVGDGQDVVSDSAGFDVIAFGAGISPSAVTKTRNSSHLVLNVNVPGNAGSITVENYFNGQETEEIRFADGTVWDVPTIRAELLAASITSGNDTILGYDGDDTINALAGNDTVSGFQGNDLIDGGSGADTMHGGTGDDTYVIDSTSDEAIENPSEGVDTVRTHLAWTLGANLENLTLTGSSNIAGTGNALDNTIIGTTGRNTLAGNDGNDWLDGGGGRDTLTGGLGDDTYVVDGTDDNVTENASAGTDTVRSSIAWTLGTNLENLTLTGTANINGTGNALANVLTGNSGANTLAGGDGNDTLDGGAGADNMSGGLGDDTYVVDNGNDLITESAGQGNDSVQSSIGYTLGANVENLNLTGSAPVNGTGNSLANTLAGNSGANVLAGGTGNDSYLFGFGSGLDTVEDADTTPGNVDTIVMAAGIAPSQVTGLHDATHRTLVLSAQDQVAIRWDPANGYRVEQVQFADGTVWDAATLLAMTNNAPTVANPIVDQEATKDEAFAFTVAANAFIDPDAVDTLTYSATLGDGTPLPSWLNFDPTTRTFSGTPGTADTGTFTVRVTATDSESASVSDAFELVVGTGNNLPVLANAIADQSATEDEAFTFTVPADTFADVDPGDTLAYSATLADGAALPSWLSFDTETRLFSGTPLNGDVGTLSVKVTASDGEASESDIFDLTTANTNDAPVVANPIEDQTAFEAGAFSFTVPADAFADVDVGDTLTYSAAQADGSALPAWLGFDPGTRTFSGTPASGDVGTMAVRVTATDGSQASVFDDFTFVVRPENHAPTVANPIVDQGATEDQVLSFTVPADAFADVDAGDTLRYSAALADGSALPSWLAFDAETRVFSGTPGNGDVGTLSIKVTAIDDADAAVSDIFDLTTANTNDAPVVTNPIADQDAVAAEAFSFTVPADAFADVDVGDTLTYSAAQADGSALPAWLGFNPATRTFSGTPASGDVGTMTLRVTATDGSQASVSDDFVINVENAIVLGTEGDDIITGSAGADTIDGRGGADVIHGGAGNDTIIGGEGADQLHGEDGDDTLDTGRGSFIDEHTFGGAGNDTYRWGDYGILFRMWVTDTEGSADRIVIDADLMPSEVRLGRPNSTFLSLHQVGTDADVLIFGHFGPDGSPTTNSIEYIEFLADGTVWDFNDIKTKLATVTEGSDQIGGFDAIDDVLFGLGGDDSLRGFLGNDTLEGGPGNDSLGGGGGDDTYVFWRGHGQDFMVDEAGNDVLLLADILPNEVSVVQEFSSGVPHSLLLNFNGSTDFIRISSYFQSFGFQIEEIRFVDGTVWTESTIAAMFPINGTSGADTLHGTAIGDIINGLGGADTIFGGDGNDTIDGGSGIDTMSGTRGDDTYVIDSTSDQAIENPGEGSDTVRTHLAWTLGANLENLTLTGSSNIAGTGNALDNTIIGTTGRNTLTGNDGNDWLDGGGGRDTLRGGLGDDTHVVDSTDDVVTEDASAGTDTVRSSIAWTLGSNLENLTLTGTANVNGTGNTLANVLTGNAGNNVLTGNAGNDTLDGQAGTDILNGGAGNDTYTLGRGHGADTIQDSDTTSGNTDIAQFLTDISPYQLWFEQSGSNLVVSVIGTPDKFAITNWYTGSENHVEQFRTATGEILLDTQVQNLVNAMASFAPPSPGQTDLPPNYATELNPVIAANWQ